jgi:hypothetical protein
MKLRHDNDMHPKLRQRETIRVFAAGVWLVSGIFLFGANATASFLSWQAAAYFIVGLLIAAVLFGFIFHLFERRVANALAALAGGRPRNAVSPVLWGGLILVAAETIVIFAVASWVFNGLLF